MRLLGVFVEDRGVLQLGAVVFMFLGDRAEVLRFYGGVAELLGFLGGGTVVTWSLVEGVEVP